MNAAKGPEPSRMCVVCRARLPKRRLLRHVRLEDSFCEDQAQKLPGRGVYVCGAEKCRKIFAARFLRRK